MFDALFILVIVVVLLAVLSALAGFIYIQIKAPLLWRLLSLLVVLCFCSWGCYHFAKFSTYANINDDYGRGLRIYIPTLDKLVVAGDTNDVHQSLVRFQREFAISDDPSDASNLWSIVGDTLGMADKFPTNGTTNRP